MREVLSVFLVVTFLFGLIVLGVVADIHEDRPRLDWCQAHGYATFKVKYQRLCVDPKTRIVYFPG